MTQSSTWDPFDLSGKVAVVTGAASGLGEAIAQALAQRGANLALIDRDAAGLAQLGHQMSDDGATVSVWDIDVTVRSDLRAAIDSLVNEHGRVDAVFANAGIGGGPGFIGLDGTPNADGEIENVTDELWDRVLAVNLTSVFTTVQRCAAHMKSRGGGGRIVVTTSIASFNPTPWIGTPYFPAKAGAAHLVRQLALELAPHLITVNAIAPGAFATDIGGGRLKNHAVAQAVAMGIPLGRVAMPDEIGGLAVFLASDASSYITGVEIPVDGGSALSTGVSPRRA